MLHLAYLAPTVEIVREKLAVFGMDDFREITAEQGEGALRAGNANGHIVAVQDENVAVQA